MSKNLAQMITDLFSRPMEGREVSSLLQGLDTEIRKVVQSEETVFGRLRGLLESFREIIPDEAQRYHAALKALSTTSRLSRQEIIAALNGQIEELKIVEKTVLPSLPAWRDGLKNMEARSQQLKGEIAQLRARLAQLEGEESALQAGIAAQEKDLAAAEKTVKDLFAGIGSEIGALHKKLAELTSVPPAQLQPAVQASPPAQPVQAGVQQSPPPPPAQPSPPPEQPGPKKEAAKESAADKKKDDEQKGEIQGAAPPKDTKFQRKCPMCGGPFNLLEYENIWQCYTCAYEEPNK